MIAVKKEVSTHNGLFRIGAVVLNEEESWEKGVPPVCAEHDFMLHFVPQGQRGVHAGKKHFETMEEAEAYIWAIDIAGFSVEDL
ncbi:MAG: hypothetical protein II837_02170 [Treponema sp.]|nr:hypothetical protein [Treponema sp.]